MRCACAESRCRIAGVMLLIRHSDRANNAVRAVSPGGELFVASVVIFMILVSFGDAVDPALFGEAGLEFGLFDLGGEFSLLAMCHWGLLQLIASGGAFGPGLPGGPRRAPALLKTPRAAPPPAGGKGPHLFRPPA